MDDEMFNNSPFSEAMNSVYPENKGIILFYNDGKVRELYGREHVMMMQEIGYWYIDNWQDFLLNFSYNGVIVMMIEFDTSLVYLPKDITDEQKNSLINYIEDNVANDKKNLLSFYIMRCLEKNNNSNKFNEVERNKRGMIRQIRGEIINAEKPLGYDMMYDYLNTNTLENNKFKIKK